MSIKLIHRDANGNSNYLTRTDKGEVHLAGPSGIALSLSYSFGSRSVEAMIAIEEQTTPEGVMRVARQMGGGQWSRDIDDYDPRKTSVPGTQTVKYTDHSGNVSFARRYENGRVSLIGRGGIPLSMSNICRRDGQGLENRLSTCTLASEMIVFMRNWVYGPDRLEAMPDRAPAPIEIDEKLEEALKAVSALLADPDDIDNVAEAEALLERYGIDIPAPKTNTTRTPGMR